MKNKIETLVSVINIKNKEQFINLLNMNNIKEPSIIINQSKEVTDEVINVEQNKMLTFTKEKGLSRSRNRAMQNSKNEICLFADEDVRYIDEYQEIINKAFQENKDADIIVFYVENLEKARPNKKIKNGKIPFVKLMQVRTYEMAIKKKNIVKNNIEFDEKFGTGAEIDRGEDLIFLADCYRKGLKIISYNKQIGTIRDKESTWFEGYDSKYLYIQAKVFYRYSNRFWWLIILQYVARKYNEYKENLSMWQALKIMIKGAREQKRLQLSKKLK